MRLQRSRIDSYSESAADTLEAFLFVLWVIGLPSAIYVGLALRRAE
jgi:hypothetical protein